MSNLGTKGNFIAGAFSLTDGTRWFSGTGAPSNGVTGAGKAGKGSIYVRTSNGAWYTNTGTKASPTWTLMGTFGALAEHHILVGNAGGVATDVAMSGDATIASTGALTIGANKVLGSMVSDAVIKTVEATISAAAIIGAAAGQLGHADGVEVVASGGAGTVLEFLGAAIVYDQGVKAYTGGSAASIRYAAGIVLSDTLAAAEFCAHNGDTVNVLKPLSAGALAMPVNTGLNLALAGAAFADGGVGAIGVVRVRTTYRVHATGL